MGKPRAGIVAVIVVASLGSVAYVAPRARADAAAAKLGAAWLDGLYDEAAAHVARGAPIVVQVHVPLCDNDVIACGNAKLGDGQHPSTNLYWGTDGGFVGWFNRRGSGWKQIAKLDAPDPARPAILERRIWRKHVRPSGAWRDRGVVDSFEVYVVADAWDGEQIDRTLAAYLDDVYGDDARAVTLPDGTTIDAGGAADIVAWVGHNRLMDLDPVDWTGLAAAHRDATRAKGVIALACHTADYMDADVPSSTRVPLLLTRDFLFAGAHAFEGVISSFASGESLAAMRKAAIRNYAKGEGRTEQHVGGAFTNPSDARWRKR